MTLGQCRVLCMQIAGPVSPHSVLLASSVLHMPQEQTATERQTVA